MLHSGVFVFATGGLFLQKATHDVDYIAYSREKACGLRFVHIVPQRYQWGLMPVNPGYRTCRESSYVVKQILKEEVTGDACCFAVDTGNEDGARDLTAAGAARSFL